MMRRFIWGGIAIAVIAGIAWMLRPDPELVDIAEVTRGPLTVAAAEDGVTRIRERYEISTPLAGRLLRITLNVGDPVIADETVVARMEPTPPALLDPRAKAQARARVQAAERRLEVAKVSLESARAAANHAEAERVRLYQLRTQDAVSDAELQQAELLARLRSDERRSAEYTVEIAQYELELERAALILTEADADAEAVGELEIRAPIDGRVLRLYHENSLVIPAGTVLMEVGDPRDLELVVDVLSRDAVRIQPGADVTVRRWGGDEPLRGRVRYVEPSGFTKISALGVEEQRVHVVIDLDTPPEQRETLGDAYRVEAEITLWHADDVLRVPTSALFRVGDAWATFVVEDEVAQQRELRIGRMNDRLAEVHSGLHEGDLVIEYPGDQIRDGVRVARR